MTDRNTAEIPQERAGPRFATVTLETPIVRGDQTIDKVVIRKPEASEMRGLQMTPLLQLDVDSIRSLLPRITQPQITKVDAIDIADVLQFGQEIIDFLLPKALKPAYPDQ